MANQYGAFAHQSEKLFSIFLKKMLILPALIAMNVARAMCITKRMQNECHIVSTKGSLLELILFSILQDYYYLLSIRRINFFNDLFQDLRHDLTIPDALALTIRYRK